MLCRYSAILMDFQVDDMNFCDILMKLQHICFLHVVMKKYDKQSFSSSDFTILKRQTVRKNQSQQSHCHDE